ncbi:acyltransferase [Thermosipho melanesiensis]|uniref:acyltransferase n=1 Tax=Thermosipho melanesiensis TaxID=46541 RepID=UPI0000ED212A|nr:acyltransferase [Thermosipho melanesiensis]
MDSTKCSYNNTNHNLSNLDEHPPEEDVIIGKNCWLGINSVILPGVILRPRTIVGAGSVVTKSFPEGNCIIAGNPAKLIKKLNCKDYGGK